jgi:tRNA threonylcarbamoyladenosine biosynthesis protein TsaE
VVLISHSAEQTQELGIAIGRLALPADVYLLVGNLGAGKTCITQGIAVGMGISEQAISPSFVIVREYKGRLPLFHMDLYRLENVAEIADLGLDEYFFGKGASVVEWADRAIELLPRNNLSINMEYRNEGERSITFNPHGQRYLSMVDELAGIIRLELSKWNWL